MAYRTQCPECGGDLYVVSFLAECSIPLSPDGFSVMDAACFNTTDEVARCQVCGREIDVVALDDEWEDGDGTDT